MEYGTLRNAREGKGHGSAIIKRYSAASVGKVGDERCDN